MSTPKRQPPSFPHQRASSNPQNPYQQGSSGVSPSQQPNNQGQQGYWADQFGNPVFGQPSQGTVRMGPHDPVGYPEVPSDPWNDNRAELEVDRQPLKWVSGPLPPGWGMPPQPQVPHQTPPRSQAQPQTQPSSATRTPQCSVQGATVQTPSPARSQPATERRGSGAATLMFFGFPTRDAPIPAHLTCYQVCQKYPNSLVGDKLDALIQHNWSAGEVYACLPPAVQAAMPQKNPTWLTNRLVKRQDEMIRDGVFDREIYRPAAQGNFLRPDGRPATITRYKSKQAVANAKTIRPDGVR